MKLYNVSLTGKSRKKQEIFTASESENKHNSKTLRDKGTVKIITRVDRYNQTNIPDEREEIDIENIVIVPETLKRELTHMCFFYIGSDQAMFEHLISHFESGYKEINFFEAGKLLQQLYLRNQQLPDVIFTDIPLDEERLKQFGSILKRNLLLANVPLIYNDTRLTEDQIVRLNELQLVDDILTIDSNQIDYTSKVMFIKQSKLYNQIYNTPEEQHGQHKTISLPLCMKRAVDIVLASVFIILLSPLLLLIAMIIRLESRGPIFYAALRAGKGFKVFKFYKFRSMVANADKEVNSLSSLNQYNVSSTGPLFFKINNDPRITKFGRILRNTSADELPQLFNVLKGDMSIVGNRPLPIYEAVTLTTNEFVERFTAPAGITGLWQVSKRGNAEMSSEERINLDIAYSRNYSFIYDLKIIVKTPLALFQKSDV